MENCEYPGCVFPVSIQINFVDETIGKYCNTHGSIFEQDVIDSCEMIENEIFLAILARVQESTHATNN